MECSGFKDIVILTTTDMHGKCWDTDPVRETPQHNNMLRISAAVQMHRRKYGSDNVLVIDNGDITGSSPIAEIHMDDYSGVQGCTPPAMVLCLREIGYDAFVPGNHEFCYAWENMSAVYRYLEEGGIDVLAANICYDGTDGAHTAGMDVFRPYTVRTINVCGHDHRIGILGLSNTDISKWYRTEHFPGMTFAHPDNTGDSIAYEAARVIPRMKADGCEFIIAAYHGGIGSSGASPAGTENQGRRLIEESEDIDMLIAGHDHMAWYSNTYVKNRSGKDIPVVNGGGRALTSTVIRFSEDPGGNLRSEIISGGNLDPGDFEVDAGLEAQISPYHDKAEAELARPIGRAAGSWDLSTDHHIRQTDTMDIVCECMMRIPAKSTGQRADMAMTPVTAGGYALRPGDIRVRDVYGMYGFSNILAVIPMYGRDIRAVLEENAARRLCVEAADGNVTLKISGDRNLNIITGGLDFVYDLTRPAGSRVSISGFPGGRAFDDDSLYYVSTVTYLIGNAGCGLRKYSLDDAVWIQDALSTGSVQRLMAGEIREYCRNSAALTPETAGWSWSVYYGANDRKDGEK